MRLVRRLILAGAALAGCSVGIGAGGTLNDPLLWGAPPGETRHVDSDADLTFGWTTGAGSALALSSTSASSIDLEQAATDLAAGAANAFTPAGCASAVASGRAVSYVFTSCRGEFDDKPFSGKATVSLSQENGLAVLSAWSSDLVLDGKPYFLDITATPMQAGGAKLVTLESRSRAPDAVDSRHSRGTFTFEQGTDCLRVEAQGSSTKGSLNTTSRITGYRRCGAHCPLTGDVTVNASDGTLTGHFDGTPTEEIVGPNGRSQTVDLDCQ